MPEAATHGKTMPSGVWKQLSRRQRATGRLLDGDSIEGVLSQARDSEVIHEAHAEQWLRSPDASMPITRREYSSSTNTVAVRGGGGTCASSATPAMTGGQPRRLTASGIARCGSGGASSTAPRAHRRPPTIDSVYSGGGATPAPLGGGVVDDLRMARAVAEGKMAEARTSLPTRSLSHGSFPRRVVGTTAPPLLAGSGVAAARDMIAGRDAMRDSD